MSDVIEKMMCNSPNAVLSFLLVLSAILNMILFFLRTKEQTEITVVNIIQENYKGIWYISLSILSFAYSILHWDIVTNFSPFSGESLIFVVFIFLILLPFIEKIQIFNFAADMSNISQKKTFKKTKKNTRYKFNIKENEEENLKSKLEV